MNARGFTGVALALVLALAAPVRADDFTFTTHVTIPGQSSDAGRLFDCALAMNGDLDVTPVGIAWAASNEEVTFTITGSPTCLVSLGAIVEIRVTDGFGAVRVYRPADSDWDVQVVTTGRHQDIYLRLKTLPRPVESPPDQ
jgi:hypothetical protein